MKQRATKDKKLANDTKRKKNEKQRANGTKGHSNKGKIFLNDTYDEGHRVRMT